MTPEKAKNLSLRTEHGAKEGQEALSKDLLEDARDQVVQNLERFHRQMVSWRNKKTKECSFPNGALVLRCLCNSDKQVR